MEYRKAYTDIPTMAPSHAPTASAKKAIMSQHALLESLVAIVTKHFNEQIIATGTRLVAALLDVGSAACDPRVVFQRIKAGNLLKENNYAFVHLATTELERALRRELEQLVPSLKKARPAKAELSLVPFEEMDNKVAFDAIGRPFEFQYASQIATLNVRLGVMLERDILRIGQNPFRPELFLSVVYQAWRDFEPDTESHPLMLALLRPAVLFDFAPMYDALCAALVNKGHQPDSVEALNIRKTEHAAASKQARARQQADLAKQLRQFLGQEAYVDELDAGIPLIPDLPSMSGAGGGWRPSAAAGFHIAAPAPGAAHGERADRQRSAHPGEAGAGHHSQAWGDQRGAHPGETGGGHHGQAWGEPRGAYHGDAGGGHHGQARGEQRGAYHGEAGGGHHGQAWGEQRGPAGGDYGMPAAANLMDLLKNLQARLPEQLAAAMPGAGGAGAGGAGPSGASGAGSVGAPNVFYLPRLKESIPKGSLSRGDESTIDLLAKIFDTVFIDPNIPAEIRELIQFLQIPVLKAALQDKNFFFEEAHPARRMIDLMSRIGMEQRKGADDPLFQAMRRGVDRVGREADDEGRVFAEAVAELEASIDADDSVATSAIAAPIAAALKQEKVTAATRSAKSAVAARVGSGEVVALLETFLENKWTAVLTVAYSVEDEKPGAVGNATKTMDELIWSVKPKITKLERKALIAKLPGLLATLNRWLDVIKWQDADRLQFFAELAECHASIVRAPLDISPERQLEIAVEVAQQDALRRLEKEQQQAQVAPALVVDDAAVAVEALERGQWLAFAQPDGSQRKVKLAWISPLRTLFIFSTGARQEAFSQPVEQLQAAFRAHTVEVLRMDGVVGRALSEAMAQAGNDPAVHSPAAA